VSILTGTDGGSALGREDVITESVEPIRELLFDVLQWTLSPLQWDHVADTLVVLESAVRAGDLPALEAASIDLELLSPVRVIRIGASHEPLAAPPQIRERINRLQHTLAAPPPSHDTREQHREESNGDRPGHQ
jgi:hypothetical protein